MIGSARASSSVAYLDSSAAIRLLVDEVESDVLHDELTARPNRVSSRVLGLEVARAARRVGTPVHETRRLLASIALDPLTERILAGAEPAGDPGLSSLDAIHLQTALDLGAGLGAFVSYDRRLVASARAAGLRVLHPGMDA